MDLLARPTVKIVVFKHGFDVTVSPEVPCPGKPENVDDLLEPDMKAELPRHLGITKDVMKRCIHLLSDPSLKLRLKVLQFFL